jgi:putative flippase GtrA
MSAGTRTFFRFALTGVLTAVSYLALCLVLQRALAVPAIASLLAYAIVVVLHFSLNNFYTFGRRHIDRRTIARYASFVLAFAILNLAVDHFVRGFALPDYVLYLTNMVVSPLLSFAVMKAYVFSRDPGL